ncbi:hypothetical protein B0T26DRAFT_281494 [Lasiosphaeria miniovina]|uniref:Uncharacterized protein n=1 Tax=Lasiosphaeria miniovina TaxID=1954250 RepID=A0AA40AJV0_9PEZI|nr:uncharacterized protein B0T26DRAFT_281494 [Lasiosphaeria miniovina]KAK0717117.1 hypothetical protein B0T26DRAFT_281494 [Lasiosphaeria miniovina]
MMKASREPCCWSSFVASGLFSAGLSTAAAAAAAFLPFFVCVCGSCFFASSPVSSMCISAMTSSSWRSIWPRRFLMAVSRSSVVNEWSSTMMDRSSIAVSRSPSRSSIVSSCARIWLPMSAEMLSSDAAAAAAAAAVGEIWPGGVCGVAIVVVVALFYSLVFYSSIHGTLSAAICLLCDRVLFALWLVLMCLYMRQQGVRRSKRCWASPLFKPREPHTSATGRAALSHFRWDDADRLGGRLGDRPARLGLFSCPRESQVSAGLTRSTPSSLVQTGPHEGKSRPGRPTNTRPTTVPRRRDWGYAPHGVSTHVRRG